MGISSACAATARNDACPHCVRRANGYRGLYGKTDVAKSAAGIVLTTPGLAGIVSTIKEGRTTFQRILTYTLRSVTHKVVQVLFLGAGLIITGHAILTPMLMVLMMITGDFLSMTSSTDNVRPSPQPNIWHIRNLTIAGIVLGFADLAFCVACLAVGKFAFGLDTDALRTMAVVTLVFSGQAVFYVSRERQHIWSSCPGRWLIVSSIVDLSIFSLLSSNGILMAALPIVAVVGRPVCSPRGGLCLFPGRREAGPVSPPGDHTFGCHLVAALPALSHRAHHISTVAPAPVFPPLPATSSRLLHGVRTEKAFRPLRQAGSWSCSATNFTT